MLPLSLAGSSPAKSISDARESAGGLWASLFRLSARTVVEGLARAKGRNSSSLFVAVPEISDSGQDWQFGNAERKDG